MRKFYITTMLILLTGFYVIPYTLLRNTRNIELFTFWTLLAIVTGLLALLFLKNTTRSG
jgi:hypothetical protein